MSLPRLTAAASLYASSHHYPSVGRTAGAHAELAPAAARTFECTSEGFYGDPVDCSKFVRCVDSGNGTLTRFDFNCGEGLIFDEDLVVCNHPWAVSPPPPCAAATT